MLWPPPLQPKVTRKQTSRFGLKTSEHKCGARVHEAHLCMTEPVRVTFHAHSPAHLDLQTEYLSVQCSLVSNQDFGLGSWSLVLGPFLGRILVLGPWVFTKTKNQDLGISSW
jgi:hypothetical protein